MIIQSERNTGKSMLYTQWSGFTLLELLATIGIAALIVLILIPAISRPRSRGGQVNCVYHLKNVGLAFRTFAGDYNGDYPWQVPKTNGGFELPEIGKQAAQSNNVFALFHTLSNEISPKELRCPQDIRIPLSNQSWAYCMALETNSAKIPSYFIGLDATEEQPQTVLAGDRNLAILSAGLDFRTRANYDRISTVSLKDALIPGTNNVSWTPQIHIYGGNILLGDGSVQLESSGRLKEQLKDSFEAVPPRFGLFYPALDN